VQPPGPPEEDDLPLNMLRTFFKNKNIPSLVSDSRELSQQTEDGNIVPPSQIEDGNIVPPSQIEDGNIVPPSQIEDSSIASLIVMGSDNESSSESSDDDDVINMLAEGLFNCNGDRIPLEEITRLRVERCNSPSSKL